MRVYSLLLVVAMMSLASCAYEGTIVQKDSSPSPFYHSLGIDGSFAFLLKDRAGLTRRQIVTPDVFSRYAVGDYFNDLQLGPSGANDPKEMKAVARVNPRGSGTVARNQKPAIASRAFASKARTKSKAVTRRIAAGKATRKMIQVRRATPVTLASVTRTVSKAPVVVQAPAAAKPRATSVRTTVPDLTEAEFVFLNVPRCR